MDPYVKMAQKEGYRARAAYKLSEIDEQDHLIKAGMVVVDLGSAPGSWSQYVRNRLTELGKHNQKIESGKPDGVIVAIDMLPMEAIADVNFIEGDFREEEGLRALESLLPPSCNGVLAARGVHTGLWGSHDRHTCRDSGKIPSDRQGQPTTPHAHHDLGHGHHLLRSGVPNCRRVSGACRRSLQIAHAHDGGAARS